MEEALAAYSEVLNEWNRERVPLNWALAQNNLGIALRRLGERESNIKRLNEAVKTHRRALEEWKRDHMPLKWAEAQKDLSSVVSQNFGHITGIPSVVIPAKAGIQKSPISLDSGSR